MYIVKSKTLKGKFMELMLEVVKKNPAVQAHDITLKALAKKFGTTPKTISVTLSKLQTNLAEIKAPLKRKAKKRDPMQMVLPEENYIEVTLQRAKALIRGEAV